MGRASGIVVCVAMLTAFAATQQKLVEKLDARLAQQAAGSAAYYQTALLRIGALGFVDLPRSVSEATQLWNLTESGAPPGVREAAACRAALASSLCEGGSAAEVWLGRATKPAGEVGEPILADYYLTRARVLCVLLRHDEELPLAIRGQACAERAQDWWRRIEAALVTLHATPNRGSNSIRKLYDRALAEDPAGLVTFFEPSILIVEADYLASRGDLDSADAKIRRAQTLASQHGNPLVMARAELTLARFASERGDEDVEAKHLKESRAYYEACGSVYGVVCTSDYLAEVATSRRRLAASRALIDDALTMSKGRGWTDREHSLLVARFNLAIKEHDGELADRLSKQIEEIEEVFDKRAVRYANVSEQLLATERERAAMEQRFEFQQRRFAERSQAAWMWGGIGAVLALGALLAISRFARRRQVHLNSELAERLQQLQEARADKEKLESRMRQIERTEGLGTLGAGIAHDFNNLLTSMIGGAELLRTEHQGRGHEELIDMILAAGKQGARLCRQLQSYAGGGPLERQPVDLLLVVNEMLPVLAAPASGALAIEVLPESRAVVAMLDRGEFEQVLLNLAVNAHEAGAKSVRIRIAEGQLKDGSDVSQTSCSALVEVTDDGEGMSEEIAQRIFDPFFTTKFPGRGLGLAVVFGGVRRHGGRVEVESSPGAGSKFSIHLPLAEKDVVLPSLPPVPVSQGQQLSLPSATTVVIVDDDDIVRRAMRRIVARLGLDPHDFPDGQEALDFVSNLPGEQSCLLLVDLSMPGMDGDEVIQIIRATGRSVRAVLMSGHEDHYVAQRAAKAAPEARLSKPFLIEDVRRVLAGVIDSMHTTR